MERESKKLVLLRVLHILEYYSDCNHPLTQDDILKYLEKDYGIVVERKAVGRQISLLNIWTMLCRLEEMKIYNT